MLVFCTAICLLGSAIFARASNLLLGVLLLATFSVPFSALVVAPFSSHNIHYTGISMDTLLENLRPRFTKGAVGSQTSGRLVFQLPRCAS